MSMDESVNLGSAYGDITIDLNAVNREFDRTIRGFDQKLTSALQSAGRNLEGLGRDLSTLFAPITAFAAGGVLAFANFDSILVEIAARTGATAEEMAAVQAKAIEMGRDTAFSATQAADAMLQLLSSGYGLNETFTALESVLNLAAAGALDLGYAADAVTDILAQFQLGAEDAGMVTDALAAAAGSSSATVSDLIDAYARVGPVAANFGLSVEETAAALAVFAENGIKGSEAGTQLRSMFNDMTRDTPEVAAMWDDLGVSMYDAEGNMRNLDDVIDDLNVAMDGMSDQERNNTIVTLAGTHGQMGLSALLATHGIDEMTDAMDEQASAAAVAAARMSSFKGVVNQAKSSLETLAIQVIEPLVEKYLTPAIAGFTEFANKISDVLSANPELAAKIGLVVAGLAAIGPVLFIAGRALSLFGGMLGRLFGVVRLVAAGISLVFSPVGLAIAGLVAAGAALYLAWTNDFMGIQETLAPVIAFAEEAFSSLKGFVDGLVSAFQSGGIAEAVGYVGDSLKAGFESLRSVDWGAVLSSVGASIKNGIAVGIDLVGKAAGWVNENVIQPLAEGVSAYISSGALWDSVQSLGADILAGLGVGLDLLNTAAGWVNENVIQPLAEGVSAYISSGALWDSVHSLGEDMLSAISTGFRSLGSIVQWVGDKIITPLAASVRAYISSGQLYSDMMSLGIGMLNGIAAGLDLITNAVQWVLNNIITPLAQAVVSYVSSGQLWEDAKSLGAAILTAIGEGFRSLGSIVQWIGTNIIAPFAAGLFAYTTSGQLFEDSKKLGEAVLNAAKEGFDLLFVGGGWLTDNVITPITNAIGGAGQSIIDAALALGSGIMDGLEQGIGDVVAWIDSTLIAPISNAISAVQGMLGVFTGATTNAVMDSAANTFGNAGINTDLLKDSGGAGRAGGLYHIGRAQMGKEAFIAGDNGNFYPDFAANLARIAGMAFGRPATPAGAGMGASGSGDMYTINVQVTPETIRDYPTIDRNARDFGDKILTRIRGR